MNGINVGDWVYVTAQLSENLGRRACGQVTGTGSHGLCIRELVDETMEHQQSRGICIAWELTRTVEMFDTEQELRNYIADIIMWQDEMLRQSQQRTEAMKP